jgi:hypothetical protein
VQRLALKVRQFDDVVVDDPDAAYAGKRKRTHAHNVGGKCIIIDFFPPAIQYDILFL